MYLRDAADVTGGNNMENVKFTHAVEVPDTSHS
jgi:hypothetical protein